MSMKLPLPLLLTFSILFAAGCSSAPAPTAKKEPPKPKEPVSGSTAFFRAYPQARIWSPDLEGMTMESITVGNVAPKEGKYPAWRIQFVSQSKRLAKDYIFSVVTAEGLNEGVYGGPDQSYSGPRGQNSTFSTQALKVDSDKAYEVAMAKGADYTKKNPDKPITMVLEHIKRFANPAWRVIWGTSAGTSNFSIYVDASTGDYLETVH